MKPAHIWVAPDMENIDDTQHPGRRGPPAGEVYMTRLRSHWTEAQGAQVSQSPMWGHSSALKGEENTGILLPLLLPRLPL